MQLFCPICSSYVNANEPGCKQGHWQRPEEEKLPPHGAPLWSCRLGGPIHGFPAVTQPLVLFGYGDRKGGGVAAVDRKTGQIAWQKETLYPVVSGVSVCGDMIVFATLDFASEGALLYGLDFNGKDRWNPLPLLGGAWSPPVYLNESRCYVLTSSGLLQCFDLSRGIEIHRNFPVEALSEPGKCWLAHNEHLLIAVSSNGQINLFDKSSGACRLIEQQNIDLRITGTPAVVGHDIYFGAEDGCLAAFNINKKNIRILAEGWRAITAPPISYKNMLFAGAHDKKLHCIDLESSQEIHQLNCGDSISSAPIIYRDLVITGCNDGRVYAFHTGTGEKVWTFEPQESSPMLGYPAILDGTIYLGSGGGTAYALPWHLGCFAWAANSLMGNKEYHAAADYYLIASAFTRQRNERETFYHKAEECWKENFEPEWAAHLWMSLARDDRAADAFFYAAENVSDIDPQGSAKYYSRAAEIYKRLRKDKQIEECLIKTARLIEAPLLRLIIDKNPAVAIGQKRRIVVRIENYGYGDTSTVSLNVSGSFLSQENFQVINPLLAQDYFDLNIDIVPYAAHEDLIISIAHPAEFAPWFSAECAISFDIEADIPKTQNGEGTRAEITARGSDNSLHRFSKDSIISTSLDFGLLQKSSVQRKDLMENNRYQKEEATATIIQRDPVLIVTATKVETKGVLDAFGISGELNQYIRLQGTRIYYDLGYHGGAPIFLTQSEMGSVTPGGAATTITRAIVDKKPQAVIMCGIAFGLRPDKQKLGDILVAKEIYMYEPQKEDLEKGEISRGPRPTCSVRLLGRFRAGDMTWQSTKVHFGLVVSGEKLINNPAWCDWILRNHPEALGGDMEGSGLYAAAHTEEANWILVKGICDWADGTKNDNAQEYAAFNAAKFVRHVVEMGGWD